MSIKNVSFPSTHTIMFNGSNLAKSVDDHANEISNTYSGGSNSRKYMIFSWDFSSLDSLYPTLLTEISSASIVSVSIRFWHNLSNDFQTIKVYRYLGGNPYSQSGATIDTRISTDVLGSISITTNTQTEETCDLSNVSSFYTTVLSDITNKTQPVVVVLARDNDLTYNNATIEIGAQALVYSGSEWRAFVSPEIPDPPSLIIEYETSEVSHPILSMRYTTLDPTSEQSSPSNSIGGHLSSNEIYPSANLAESISSSQKYIPINDDSSLPDTTGIASIGPEIFKYTSIDKTIRRLTGITRGISPLSSFPAGFSAYKIPEKVYYLHNNTSTNLNELFDTRPTSGLVQYRCVCIVNTYTSNNFAIKDVFVGLAQNPNNNVLLDVGIEVPKHDSYTSVSDSGTTTSVIIDSYFSLSNGFESGIFDGSAIKILSGINEVATIESFDNGEFILSRSISGLSASKDFVIYPAPCQSVANDSVGPSYDSGRFSGFLGDGSTSQVTLSDHGNIIYPYDCFYIWIKRTLKSNVKETGDSGASIIIRFMDN